MKFGSWTYDGNQLDLVLNSEDGGDLSDFITNGEWYLIVRQMSPYRNIPGASGHSRWWPLLPKYQISCPVSKTLTFDTHIAPTLMVPQMSPYQNIPGASGHSRSWPLLPICQISCPVSKTLKFDTHIAPTLMVRQMSPYRNIPGASGKFQVVANSNYQFPLMPAGMSWGVHASKLSAPGPPGHLLPGHQAICSRATKPSAPDVFASTSSSRMNFRD
ncbi:conserved hypothetical protein [Culex quinquefasciatus]|uniref:Uncharacterized protein n=1 Tax=Culex quinquefasciatus TaxID=7176 RepID=B0WVE4_CULQU|nr:conserved hypothetical protein [Culex quinquefasciatus]|eukprot:XP_001861366.1 conserved hypothetical protein [Culex quinquefasciatus]